ncbi:DUF6090 family protein [Draconibacterium sp. IB214405]|uniref:DUF6090 family protein n=1 Tax=Draconibacterium sp. IB214405 TaxID=3097352 RepID=UPI002A0C411A|nr:DUF6090 family protein [Draconibacterium sp. IB214405]MDX8341577.1 DUF6090 family protein [Draconibacterium sp. IB214405]
MIKFFRTLRYRLIGENKVKKYLFYALGEIILVVIGILIALAINNNNVKRNIQKKEQTYLVGLKEEFKISKIKLQELINVNKHNYEGARQIIAYISNSDIQPGEKEFSELLYKTLVFDISFNPNNSLLNEMVNSGSLKDISNPDLRIYLTNWISTLDDIAKQEEDLGEQRELIVDMFQGNEQSIRTIFDLSGVTKSGLDIEPRKNNVSNLNLLSSTEFENKLLLFILSSEATETAHYEPLMENIDAILDLIEMETKD